MRQKSSWQVNVSSFMRKTYNLKSEKDTVTNNKNDKTREIFLIMVFTSLK